MITRKPPKFYQNPIEYHCPSSLKAAYQLDVRKFFSDYHPNEADNLEIIDEIILDPVNYTVLTLLRLAIVTRSDLEKLRMKGVDDIDKVLDLFKSLHLITTLHDEKGIEYFGLISDFEISQFFPKYMLNSIRKNHMVKLHSNLALLTHLEILDEEFSRLLSVKKKNKGEEIPESYTATDSPMNLDLEFNENL